MKVQNSPNFRVAVQKIKLWTQLADSKFLYLIRTSSAPLKIWWLSTVQKMVSQLENNVKMVCATGLARLLHQFCTSPLKVDSKIYFSRVAHPCTSSAPDQVRLVRRTIYKYIVRHASSGGPDLSRFLHQLV